MRSRWALVACGGDGNGGNEPSVNITGTFIGEATASITPGEVYTETLQLTQDGNGDVTGTLVTTNGRTGNVSGSVSGTRLTSVVDLTDVCGGSSETTADITEDGTRLVGTYEADDCLGTYSLRSREAVAQRYSLSRVSSDLKPSGRS